MDSNTCHYEILGVDRSCDSVALTQAYRRLAMLWHPDRHTDATKASAEDKFKIIKVSYEVLSNALSRRDYDLLLERKSRSSRGSGGSAGGRGRPQRGRDWTEANFHGSRNSLPKGEDVYQTVVLDVLEAQEGSEFVIEDESPDVCDACYGQGGTKYRCVDCHGHGSEIHSKGRLKCNPCNGNGFLKVACEVCRGRGRSSGKRSYSIRIPGGQISGSKIVSQGKGKASAQGGLAGDMVLTIKIKAPEGWRCDGADLYGYLEIGFDTALLGGDVTVDMPTGKSLVIRIPAMTNTGKVLRLQGKGMKDSKRESLGDAYLKARIVLPKVEPEVDKVASELIRSLYIIS